jgi:hypothetical protein
MMMLLCIQIHRNGTTGNVRPMFDRFASDIKSTPTVWTGDQWYVLHHGQEHMRRRLPRREHSAGWTTERADFRTGSTDLQMVALPVAEVQMPTF